MVSNAVPSGMKITRLGKFHAKIGVWGALSAPQTPIFAL